MEWVVDEEEVSGTLIYPGKTVKASRVARCADYSGAKMASQRRGAISHSPLATCCAQSGGTFVFHCAPRVAGGEWQVAIALI